MKEFTIPAIIQKINKEKGKTKISTLTKAKALRIKRFFSGSFCLDEMIGGGYAYKRIHLLFGAKSSGKNASLYQMLAYNQRICRICHGIRPDIPLNDNADRWTIILRDILRLPVCKCPDNVFSPRIFCMVDFEKTLGIESPRIVTVCNYQDSLTGAKIDELDYNDKLSALTELEAKEELTEKQKAFITETEEWLKTVKVTETKIEQLATFDYLEKCGVIAQELLVSDPSDTEEATEYMREIIKNKGVDGIILDSLQAAVPKYVKDRESDEATMGAEPKANALMVRHVCSAYAAEDIENEENAFMPALFINSQVRSTLGFVKSAPTYSGGHAVAHLIALAMEFHRLTYLKEDGTPGKDYSTTYYGQRIRLRTEKTKLAAPADLHEIDYYFKDGNMFKTGEIDHVAEIVSLGINKGYIQKAGPWYEVKNEKFQGIEKLKEFFRINPTFVGELYKDMQGL